MSVKVATIMQIVEKIAPKKLAYEWDNVGLLIGDPKQEVDNILVSLDINEDIVDEAIKNQAKMIITHHPIILKPIKNIRWDTSMGQLLKKLIENSINVYCAHTNLDLSENGVNKVLFDTLKLTNEEILKPEIKEQLYKFVVFVPLTHVEEVKMSMGNAGAGWIGNYSHCSFSAKGVGSFKPTEGTNPYIGQPGVIENVEEMRLETIVPEKLLNKVLNAVLKAHPYEEVAYDIYPLSNTGKEFGLGRLGKYSEPVAKEDFIKLIKNQLEVSVLKVAGNLPSFIEKVAVCGGSGGSMIQQAAFRGAQVLVTGDVSYHQAQDAQNLGLCVVDAGHGVTEKIAIPYFADLLHSELIALKINVGIIVSKINSDPWLFV